MSAASCSCSSLDTHSQMEKAMFYGSMGTQRVHFQQGKDWDFILETQDRPVDTSLLLPHYRARSQPLDHRMSMFIGSDSGPIKVKVCRQLPSRTPFLLEISSDVSDVTVWLPSDFRGRIQHSASKVSFSAGFTNRIMQHVRFYESEEHASCDVEDEVVVNTDGSITFRMWDVQTCSPENRGKEVWKRMFKSTNRKAPETAIDWDFLLDD